MKPERWLIAIALKQEHQRHHDVPDDQDGEVGRGVIGAIGFERQLACRAMAAHLEKTAKQGALAAPWTPALPTAQQGGPELNAGGGQRHADKMAARLTSVVATVCPERPGDARPDAAAYAVRCSDGGSWPEGDAPPVRSARRFRTAVRRLRCRPRRA